MIKTVVYLRGVPRIHSCLMPLFSFFLMLSCGNSCYHAIISCFHAIFIRKFMFSCHFEKKISDVFFFQNGRFLPATVSINLKILIFSYFWTNYLRMINFKAMSKITHPRIWKNTIKNDTAVLKYLKIVPKYN